MSTDFRNLYSYVDPTTGEHTKIHGEEGHNDKFAVLSRPDRDAQWQLEGPHQMKRTAEVTIEHLKGTRPGWEYEIVELTPVASG